MAPSRAAAVRLKPGHERKLLSYYPWAYREDLEPEETAAEADSLVEVRSAAGEFVAWAFYNPASHIPLRVISRDPAETINQEFFRRRLRAADMRRAGRVGDTDAYRVVHAEADDLPGLIVDRLGPVLVVQFRNPGMDARRDEIVRALKSVLQPGGIFERSDVEARAEEGLPPRTGPLWGEIPDPFLIHEADLQFQVSVTRGQKTGFFLDQRENRQLFRRLVTGDARVLDVYCYTGAFGLHAARQGAQVLGVDKDSEALQALEQNARLNGLAAQIGARWGDALEVLQDLAREGRRFSHIVLDPPTLVRHKEDVPRVKKLFVAMAAHAVAVLDPGGTILLSSCAYHLGANDLLEVARLAANDAGRRAEVRGLTYQPADHPWILQIPETLYLKTLVLQFEG